MPSSQEYSRFRLHRSRKLKPLRKAVARKIILTFEAMARSMSISAAQKIGGVLGSLLFWPAKREREICLYQLGFCFPEKSEKEILRITRDCFRHFCISFMEFLVIERFRKEFHQKIHCHNTEILQKHFEEKNGCILLASHFGNWELLSLIMEELKIPTMAGAKQYEDPVIDKMILKRRENEYMEVVARDNPATPKSLVRCIKNKGFLIVLVDIDTDLESVYANFFGYPCKTPSVAAKFCLKYRFPAVMAYDFRREDGSHDFFFQEVHSPEAESSEPYTVESLTEKFNLELEKVIRQKPESWVWFHRRWRNQKQEPEGSSANSQTP